LRPSGNVRVTSTDTLTGSILPEVLAGFRAAHPGIRVELTVSNLMLNLSRRDADVAIRPATDPPETLIGRRVARIAFAIYGSRSSVGKRGKIDDLAAQPWVAPDDSLSDTSVARWMHAELPESEITFRADSLFALRQAARAGLGLVALPCYLGDTTPDLVCVHSPIKAMETMLWVLTHESLKHTARIRTFTDFVVTAFKRHRGLLEGENARPQSASSSRSASWP
jgi:DNA-binding transcriptional LysR family regulator